ncbi:TetR/AcrR family transcriptional regulator C-terminal ligand-binding domain-containing protein [Streptomyces griseochromogenes]|uniref:TetR/AcrR family transcriptional regulator C-terminal ligand-binding domain-containing protein n=1 Tax=Streptomyces griseochromogenes TaxID=68214 RepID=UPI0037AA621C
MDAVATLWQRAVDRGDASPDTDVDDVIDILFGPLIFRRLTGHYDLTDEHAEKLARTALDGLMRSTVRHFRFQRRDTCPARFSSPA